MESSLSVEELMITLKAVNDRDTRDKKFQAALQGVDLDEESSAGGEDITKIKGFRASQDGFGIGMGLGHVTEG